MTSDKNLILESERKLEKYIREENYHGYDPFDALTSPFFNLPLINKNKIIRLGSQQVLKRLPLNTRSLIGIKKRLNPVTLGLCIQAYSCLIKQFPENEKKYSKEIEFCVNNLIKLKSMGFSGACWGYDFDWEARYAKIPAYGPTVVATGIITNSLFENYLITGNQTSKELCVSAVEFIMNDLNKTYDESGNFCYSYSPFDKQRVLNATMKGARLLAQVYSLNGDISLFNEAKKIVKFVSSHQKSCGGWNYSVGDTRTWIDNFHTAYILDCLDAYIKFTKDDEFDDSLKRGLDYYLKNFFVDNRIPKYYDNSIYPIDMTSVSQSIITLLNFGYNELAQNVAEWAIKEMQDEKGFFYFRKGKHLTNKISYMRWSNAWMFVALSKLLKC